MWTTGFDSRFRFRHQLHNYYLGYWTSVWSILLVSTGDYYYIFHMLHMQSWEGDRSQVVCTEYVSRSHAYPPLYTLRTEPGLLRFPKLAASITIQHWHHHYTLRHLELEQHQLNGKNCLNYNMTISLHEIF